MSEKMNILVVDDNKYHQKAAGIVLPDHNVVIANSFDTAIDELVKNREKQYDAVLTDLLFPQGRGDMMREKDMAFDEHGFGFPVAMIAATQKVPYVAVVTDGGHHDHPIVYTFDFLGDRQSGEPKMFKINDTRCIFVYAGCLNPTLYIKKDGTITEECPYDLPQDSKERDNFIKKGDFGFITAKNWKAALEKLVK